MIWNTFGTIWDYIIIQYHSRIGVPNFDQILGVSWVITLQQFHTLDPLSYHHNHKGKLCSIPSWLVLSHPSRVISVWSSSWAAQWSWENSAHLRTSEGTPSNVHGNASDSLGTPRSLAAQVAVVKKTVGPLQKLQKPVTQTFLGVFLVLPCLINSKLLKRNHPRLGPVFCFRGLWNVKDAAVPGCFPVFFKNCKTSCVVKITMKIWSC